METSTTLSHAGKICRERLATVLCGSTYEKPTWGPEALARFDFWAKEAGLFSIGRHRLDHQVVKHPGVRAMIHQFLEGISMDVDLYSRIGVTPPIVFDAATRMGSECDEDDVDMASTDEVRLRISDSITRLIRLSRQMRHHVKRKLDTKADKYDPKDHDDKPLALEFEGHIEWKLSRNPRWQIDSDTIKDRLRKTMMLRWRRIYFHSVRASKKGVTPMQVVPRHDTNVSTTLEAPKDDFKTREEVAVAGQPDENEGCTQVTQGDSLFTAPLTVGTSFKPHEDTRSVATSRKTKSLLGVKAIDFPKAPAIRPEISGFMCPLCGSLQQATERERKTWHTHVLRDLAPYICLYESCRVPDAIYRTSKEWLAHMDAMHPDEVWVCHICDCEFENETLYRKHLSDPQIHRLPANLSPEALSMLVRMNTVPRKFPKCFFCPLKEGEVDDIRMHMAEHLRNFALASIPWHVLPSGQSDDGSKTALGGAGSKRGGSSVERMERYIDEVALSFDENESSIINLQALDRPSLQSDKPKQTEAYWQSRIIPWLDTMPEHFFEFPERDRSQIGVASHPITEPASRDNDESYNRHPRGKQAWREALLDSSSDREPQRGRTYGFDGRKVERRRRDHEPAPAPFLPHLERLLNQGSMRLHKSRQ